MTETNKLFTPINGVIVEFQKETNTAGIEVKISEKKNEGIIVSKTIRLVGKAKEEFKDLVSAIDKTNSKKIKFLEGYPVEENLMFVPLDKIIGIFD